MGEALERYKRLKAQQGGRDDGGGFSLGGLAGNVFGDLKDIVTGLGTLAVTAVKDFGGETLEAVPLLPYEHSSTLDDLAQEMPGALARDLGHRYGPLLPGGEPAGLALERNYEDPLALVGDALTIATAGGYGAAKGATAAARAGNVGRYGGRPAGALTKRILPGIEDAPGTPLAGTRPALSATGREVTQVERALNPSRRLFEEKVVDRALTRPLRSLERDRDSLLSRVEELETPELIDLQLTDQAARLARDAGIARVPRQGISNRRLSKLMGRITAESKAMHIGKRDEAMGQWREIFDKLPDDQLDNFHLTLQLTPPEAKYPRLNYDQVIRALEDPTVTDTPLGSRLESVVRPHVQRLEKMLGDPEIDPTEIEAGRRIIEAVAGEPLAAFGDETIDAVSRTMDEARLLNFEQQASRFIEEGGTYQSLLARQYLPMRVNEKAQQGLKSFEEATDPFVLDDAIKASGRKTPVYYPHYETLTSKASDFLMSTNLHRARQQAKVSAHKKSSGKLFENELRGVRDAYETNPADAFSRLAAEVVKHDEMNRWIENVAQEVGRPISARDELSSSEVVMNLDGVRLMIRRRREAMEKIHENLEGGLEPDEAFARAMEEVFPNPDKDIVEVAGGRHYAIPKAAADRLQAETRYMFNRAGVRLFVDAPTNVWRNLTLYVRPAYYVNNVFGNTSFLKLQGGKMSNVLRQLDKRYIKRMQDAIPEELRPQVEQGFYSGAQQRATHLGKLEGTRTGQAITAVKGTRPVRGAAKARDRAQDFNQYLENVYRRESFMTAVEKQASKRGVKLAGTAWIRSKKRLDQIAEMGADPQVSRKALDEMNRAMNNYNALSPFERQVVRRFFAPFWAFYSHAARTLFRMPFEHPAKARLLQWVHDTNEEMSTTGDIPEWLESFVPLGPGDEPGETRFASTRGINPLAGVTESPLSLMHPALQAGFEQVTGRDTFTGRPFSAPNVYNDPISGTQFMLDENGVPQPVERGWGGLRAGVAPSLTETLVGSVAPADLVRDLLAGGATYSAGGGTITNPNGEPTYPIDPLQKLLGLAGASTLDYNVPKYQAGLNEARGRALDSLVERP